MGGKNKCLIHASIFSGIGGFDLAAEWIGWKNVFHCEINDFCRKLLKHYFPNAESYGDIKKTDFGKYRGKIGVLTGGFPCHSDTRCMFLSNGPLFKEANLTNSSKIWFDFNPVRPTLKAQKFILLSFFYL